MAGREPPPLPSLADLAAQVAQVQAAVIQLQQVAGVMAEQMRHPPVHLSVQHLEVHTLEFRLDSIDVDSLSGELNIGLTSKLTAGPSAPAPTLGAQAHEAASQPEQPVPQRDEAASDQAEAQLLWPGHPGNRSEKEATGRHE